MSARELQAFRDSESALRDVLHEMRDAGADDPIEGWEAALWSACVRASIVMIVGFYAGAKVGLL